jgi:gliding motility-associated-like protein
MFKTLCLIIQGILFCSPLFAQTSSIPAFVAPDTVCVNTPVTITNNSIGASTYYWNFCVADINSAPAGSNLGNIGNHFSGPVFMDYVYANNNYYGFVTNYTSGNLTRLDFGNSLLNAPTGINLGNFGGILQAGSANEGIQIVQNEGKWYAIIVGGNSIAGTQPRLVKIEFGTNIANPNPVATNWGNIGGMQQPIDLHVFQENNNWYGFTVNAEDNSIVRFNFTNSFDNTPTAINLGNIGNLAYPTGIYAINDNGFWRVFVLNAGDNQRIGTNSSITRLDFGNSLLNAPTGVNLGNPSNILHHPRDLTIMKFCGQIIGFAVNGNPNYNDIVRLDFKNDLASIPALTSIGNIGNLDFPHSISKLFRVNDEVYGFITNVANNTVTRLQFQGCTNASISSSTAHTPPAVTYNTPGTYNINLTTDDGLPTQSSLCKQVVVLPGPVADFSFVQDACSPNIVRFTNESTNSTTIAWDFGDGNQAGNDPAPTVQYALYGTYAVQLKATGGGRCAVSSTTKQVPVRITNDNVIVTKDTVLCAAGALQFQAVPALSYCWTPATGLSSTSIANPIATISAPITYYLNAQTTGNNLIANGDFSQGNTGFTSAYNYATPNVTEGQYYVGSSPRSWNPSLSNCTDHTSGNGNMLLVNGSPTLDVNVWKQTITVTPNTNYAFSTWIQALWPPNPAQLSFSINGSDIGNTITASLPTCTWSQFYIVWNSGNNTSATISIVNKNTQIQGNDFALDDISFAPVFIKRDSVVITIEKPVVTANNDTTICNKQPVQLLASGAHSYTWSPANGLSNTSVGNPIATIAVSTQYIVTGSTLRGCTAKDTVNITVLPKPVILAFQDTTICPEATVQLQANSSLLSWSWSPTATLDNPAVSNPVASPWQSTIYFVEVRDANNCAYKDSVAVQIRSTQFAASPDQAMCEGTSIVLKASGGDHYLWAPADLVDDAQSATPVATPEQTTQYSVYISENTCGRDTTIQMNVTVNPSPVVAAQKSNDINCTQPTSQLQASGGITYLWSPVNGVDYADKPNPVAAVDTTTRFYVRGTNEYGCSAIDSIQIAVTVAGKESFLVPNAFTPNNDGHNDCISIKRWGSAVIEEFTIYSRWGERLFTTNNPRECWNGWYKGKLMDNGAYAYVIRAKTFCGPVKRTGVIMLIR